MVFLHNTLMIKQFIRQPSLAICVFVRTVMLVRLTDIGREVDGEGSNWLLARILKQLRDQEIIILHTNRKLLHVYEILYGRDSD